MTKYFFFLFFFCLSDQKLVLSQQATLYDHSNYGGDNFKVSVGSTCKNVFEFNDRASSIKTNYCIRLWEHGDCTGRSIDIASPGSDHLGQLNFNDLTSSVSPCTASKDKVEINVDTKDAPELANFGRNVKKIMQDWFPFVQNLMTTPAYKPVKKIDVYFDPNYDGVAYASGSRIVGAVKFFKNHQDDYGAFIHEMTHVVHQANCPGWLIEGYAEWTRRWFYEPWTVKNKPSKDADYKNGYSDAAWLIAYVNSAITGKPMAFLLNKACQDGTWTDNIWQELTGKTVDQLWHDMLNDDGYPWKK